MSKSHYCPCGMKFEIRPEMAGREVPCPDCGKLARIAAAAPIPTVAAAPEPEEEVLLQELPELVAEEIVEPEEEEGVGYGLDAKDGRAELARVGAGFWASLGVIQLEERATCLAYGATGALALAGQGNDVQVVCMKAHKRKHRFREHDDAVTSVAISPDGELGLSGDENGDIYCWELATGKRIKRFEAHEDAVLALAFSPCGKYAVSGGADGCIRQWKPAVGKYYRLDKGEWDEAVVYVSYSTDGLKLFAGGGEGRISLWAAKSCSRLQRYDDATQSISCVRLGAGDTRITAACRPATSGFRGHPRYWRWDTTGALKDFARPLNAASGIPVASCLDQAGLRLIVGGRYPLVDFRKHNPFSSTVEYDILKEIIENKQPYCLEVWNLDNAQRIHAYLDVKGVPGMLAVSPDNTRILAALDNMQLQIFGMPIA